MNTANLMLIFAENDKMLKRLSADRDTATPDTRDAFTIVMDHYRCLRGLALEQAIDLAKGEPYD